MIDDREKSTVLVVDDDPDILDLASVLLGEAGYEVLTAKNGTDGLSLAFSKHPSLVLVDYDMPDMTGLEVIDGLRSHLSTRQLPVLLLTARSTVSDRVIGLRRGADDYIVKPFEHEELTARVDVAIRRRERDLAADPLTKLPGNLALRQEISRRWGTAFSVAYIDLDHFKAYVDSYGFESASEVIVRLGQILYNCIVEHGVPEDFVGHIGGDDFILIADESRAVSMSRLIRDNFRELLEAFYDAGDFSAGFILGTDRYGMQRKFPLLDLSIAVINITPDARQSRQALGEFSSESKKRVKQAEGDAKVQSFSYTGHSIPS